MATSKPKPLAYTLGTIDNSSQIAANTQARVVLIARIKALIAINNWAQSKAASLSNLTQPRISYLLRGNVSRFSLDALVNITSALERHSSGISTAGGRVALVGDIVRYPDGSESRIVSSAGVASVYLGNSIALVGSELDNGDKINGPMHNGMTIVQYADDEPIKGLPDRTYVPPQPEGGQHG